MKTTTSKFLVILSLLTSASSYGLKLAPIAPGEETSPQSPEYQLRYLYQQRNAMLSGLDNLSRNICFSSRITTVGKLLKVLNDKKRQDLEEESVFIVDGPKPHSNSGVAAKRYLSPNLSKRLILPIADHRTGEIERKKSRVINRMIANASNPSGIGQSPRRNNTKITEEGAGERFANHYYTRRQCIVGEGLANACRLLTGSEVSKEFKELRAKLSDHKFLSGRFDGMRACAALSEKSRYRSAIQKVQMQIDELEKTRRDTNNENNVSESNSNITGGATPDQQIKRESASTDNGLHIDLIP